MSETVQRQRYRKKEREVGGVRDTDRQRERVISIRSIDTFIIHFLLSIFPIILEKSSFINNSKDALLFLSYLSIFDLN